MTDVHTSLARLVFTLVIAVLRLLYRGVIIMMIWRWHVVPVFGLHALSFSQSISLNVFVNALLSVVYLRFASLDENAEQRARSFGQGIGFDTTVLLVSWLIHLAQVWLAR